MFHTLNYSLEDMWHESIKSTEFDRLLDEPFSRLERMAALGPVERCTRMLQTLEALDAELTHFLNVGVVLRRARNSESTRDAT